MMMAARGHATYMDGKILSVTENNFQNVFLVCALCTFRAMFFTRMASALCLAD